MAIIIHMRNNGGSDQGNRVREVRCLVTYTKGCPWAELMSLYR